MSEKHCATCTCTGQPPDYPVTCRSCGVTYGDGGELTSHNPGGDNCLQRQAAQRARQAQAQAHGDGAALDEQRRTVEELQVRLTTTTAQTNALLVRAEAAEARVLELEAEARG